MKKNVSVLYSQGPFKKAYQPSTGFGCGYGQSQIIDAQGRPIAGVAMVAPEVGDMYEKDGYSQEAFDCLEANATLLASSWLMLDKLRSIEAQLAGHPDAEKGNSKVNFALCEARNGIAAATAAEPA